MGYYVIAIGGTGNKILESVVYGACADAFHTRGDGNVGKPLPMIRMLAVDVDAACGNTTRAKQAADYYERVRSLFPAKGPARRGFHTRLVTDRWNMNLSKRATSVERMVQNHKRDQLLANTLFDRTEASLEYSEGFRGHPDLGVLFFADLLSDLPQLAAAGQPDEMIDMLREMRGDMERGEQAKVILCGSIFGGTGASGIPTISQYLRKHFAGHGPQLELAAVLMLPYYKVPPSSQNEELEIVVKSSTFMDKARTALQYYGMEGMIKSGESDEKGVFDALYLLGMPPEAFITTRMYSTGSQSQENDAHMLEWLAMRCIARFFRTGFRGRDSHNIDCYYYQFHSRTFRWESFDEEANAYRIGYGGMLKASAAFFTECYPYLRARISGKKRGRNNLVNYYAAWFLYGARLKGPQQAKLEKNLDALYHCLAFYCNWVCQVVRTLPPTLRGNRRNEELAAKAAAGYDRLVDRYVLLQEKLQGGSESDFGGWAERAAQQEAQDEYDRMLARQRELLRKLGGSARMEMLKDAQQNQREVLLRQEEAIRELESRVEAWEGEDGRLVEEQALRQEKERLGAMRRVAEILQAKGKKIGQDVEEAIRENILGIQGEEEEAGDDLPDNDLFHPGLVNALRELLELYGSAKERRDPRRMEMLSDTLRRGLSRIIVQPVPDRADMPRVMAGVAGEQVLSRDPDRMLSGFWAALLNAAMEEANP